MDTEKQLIAIDKQEIKEFIIDQGLSLARFDDMTTNDFQRIVEMKIFDDWYEAKNNEKK